MKRSSAFFTALFISLNVGFGYDIYLDTTEQNALWSDNTNWKDYSTGNNPETAPNSNTVEADLWWNTTSVSVDGDYTLKMLGANRDTGCSEAIMGEVYINMKGSKSDGSDGSLTFDLANNSNGFAIDFLTSAYLENAKNLRFIFEGGSLNFTDTVSDTVRTAVIRSSGEAGSAGQFGTEYTKTTTFNTVINSTEHLAVQGWNFAGEGPITTFNFNGDINLYDAGASEYRNFTILGNNAGGTTLVSTVNIGASSNFVAASYKVCTNTETVIDGNVELYNTSATPMNEAFYVEKGGKATINGSLSLEATENKAMSVSGELILNGSLKSVNRGIEIYGKMTVNENATMSLSGGDPYLLVNGGELTLNNINKIDAARGLRIQNSTVTFNSDALSSGTIVWMVANYGGSGCVINVNSDLNFNAFSWVQGNRTTINFADGVVITLDMLSKNRDDWGNVLTDDVLLTLNNFENGAIRVTSLDERDDLSLISADGFEDGSFKFVWHDETGNYWLEATAIPEPAAMSGILGAFALSLLALRRRR